MFAKINDENRARQVRSTKDGQPQTRRALGQIQQNVISNRDAGRKDGVKAATARSVKPTPREQSVQVVLPSGVIDIDVNDRSNVQLASDYIHEIVEHFRRMETAYVAPHNYMSSQTDINERMRSILMDWLVDVHLKFKLVPETLYYTVNYIDRFLSKATVPRQKLQLVGVTAMLIASKYEEIYAPEVRDFVYITDRAYSRNDILEMERKMLDVLQFNLTTPLLLDFVKRFCKAASAGSSAEVAKAVLARSQYVSELTLPHYQFLKYKTSTLGAACVFVAMKTLTANPWNATMQFYTQHSDTDLQQCVRELKEVLKAAPTANLTAVHKKWSCQKYGETAQCFVFSS